MDRFARTLARRAGLVAAALALAVAAPGAGAGSFGIVVEKGAGSLVLSDGRTVILTPTTRFFDADGKPTTLAALPVAEVDGAMVRPRGATVEIEGAAVAGGLRAERVSLVRALPN